MSRARSSASGSPGPLDPEVETALGPIRTCIGCRARRSPGLLVRVVASDETPGFVSGAAAAGRGAWLCAAPAVPSDASSASDELARALGADPRCVATAVKRNAAARAFRRGR